MLTNSTNAYLKQGDELLNHDVLSKLWKTIVNLWHNIIFAHAMSGALLIPGTKKGLKMSLFTQVHVMWHKHMNNP